MLSRRHKSIVYGLALLLFVMTRVFVLYSPSLYEGIYFREQPHVEEFLIGNIASEILRGPIVPVGTFVTIPFEGYMLVNGLLTVPFFAMLGSSYAALKMASIVFSLGTLILLALFARRQFGRRAALLVMLLVLLPPPGVLRFSLWAMGNYPQGQLFVAGNLLLLFCLCFPNGNDRRVGWRILALGLLCGFSLYFHPILVISVAHAVLVVLLFRRDLIRPRRVALFIVAVLLGSGVRPLRNYLSLSQTLPFYRYGDMVNPFDQPARALLRFRVLFAEFIPRLWYFEDVAGRWGGLLNWIFYALLIAAVAVVTLLAFARSSGSPYRRDRLRALLLYPIVFVLFFTLARQINPLNIACIMYLNLLLPFVVIALALLFDLLIRSERGVIRKGALALLALLLGINLVSLLGLIGPLGKGYGSMTAVNAREVGIHIGRLYVERDPNPMLDTILEERPGEEGKLIVRGFCESLTDYALRKGESAEVSRMLERLEPRFRTEAARAVGSLAGQAYCFDGKTERLHMLGTVSPDERSAAFEGFGGVVGYHLIARFSDPSPEGFRQFDEVAALAPDDRPALYRGLGAALVWRFDPRTHERLRRDEGRLKRLSARCSPEQREHIEEGSRLLFYRFGDW